ncbi:hypothetical protein LIER_29519 [Lithospermum erythrorhizon]|uniref:Uncharacterized protein n=1 Tax=Lithospermum erythrorhizon TaxID=34254 RepID=A0AAV3RLC2_LITER
MDLSSFMLDIDDLMKEFVEGTSTTLKEMKNIWRLKKFTYIFEASPSTNQGYFMQSLYAHSIGYLISASSLSHRLGGLYCLYCLYETQPFKPPFKIYLSLEELKRVRQLVTEAKQNGIGVVSSLVRSMLDRNLFLFGFVDLNQGSVTDRINELANIQNARIQVAYKKLMSNTKLEQFIHMDMGSELDVKLIKKQSTDYAAAKKLAMTEARELVDVENIKHIAEDKRLIGDFVEKTAEDWNAQKEMFYQRTGLSDTLMNNKSLQLEREQVSKKQKVNDDNSNVEDFDNGVGTENSEEHISDDQFGKELEDALLALPLENDI